MKTKSFEQLISEVIAKGADSIKITRSKCFAGCIRPNDIISIEVKKNGNIWICDACHVFDNPTIEVDRVYRNETGRCTARFTIGEFIYAK